MLYCHKCDCKGTVREYPDTGEVTCDGCDGRGMKFACRTCGCGFAASKLNAQNHCEGCVNARIAFNRRVRDEGIVGKGPQD